MNQLGLELRDEALDRLDLAHDQWKADALTRIKFLSLTKREFTTDDVWLAVDAPPEPKAMGAAIREAARRGWIKSTKRYVQSDRPECHARPILVWQSRALA